MDLSKLKINHWLTGIGAIVLLIVTVLGGSLFPWFKKDIGVYGLVNAGTYKEGAGFLGWLALLLALGAAVLMLLPMLDVKLPENVPWAIIELASGGACALFLLLQLAIGKSYGYGGLASVTLDRSYGLFLAVLAGLAVGGGSALEFLEARKSGGASLGGGGSATPPPPPPSTPPPPPSS